jgi:Bifunctional DNA primase/polymerase, N-terminal
MADSKANGSSSKISRSSLRIAKLAIARGWSPVPLRPRSKRPSAGEGWNLLRVTSENAREYFKKGNENVGILWGEPSHWAVDVDLDCTEAVAIAPAFLPETYIYGRAERPRTHHVFTSIECPTQKWFDGDQDMIIEVRSTGAQTVWVGSVHPDGDLYEVDDDVELAEIESDELLVRCGQIAATVLLARSYPKGGARHDYIHAVTGALLRDGLQSSVVRRMLAAIISYTDRETDRPQRLRTVDNTIKSNGRDGHTYGWRTLASWLDEKTSERIKNFLKTSRFGRAPDIVVTDSRKPSLQKSSSPVESVAPLALPSGLTAEIAAWAASRAYVVGPEFDTAAALMCTALASGNRYVMQNWRTPLQPYMMVLSPTGGGKDGVIQAVYDFARRVELRENVFQSFQSYHSMLDTLVSEPSIACWLWDEAARKLKTAGRQPGSQDYQILSHLLGMYGRAAVGVPGMPGRSNAIPPIERPFFITLALAQPDQMVEAITNAELATGLLARFLLIDTGDRTGKLRHERVDIFPARIEAYIRKFRDVALPTGGFVEVAYETMKIYNRFKDFAEHSRAEMNGNEHAELWNRACQNALIIAGLLAIGRDVTRPKVSSDIADYAIEMATRSVNSWIRRLTSSAAGVGNEKLVRQLENIVKNAREYAERARKNRPTEAQLLRNGKMPQHILKRLVRFDKRRDIEDAIKVLIEAKVINEGMSNGTHVYWYL